MNPILRPTATHARTGELLAPSLVLLSLLTIVGSGCGPIQPALDRTATSEGSGGSAGGPSAGSGGSPTGAGGSNSNPGSGGQAAGSGGAGAGGSGVMPSDVPVGSGGQSGAGTGVGGAGGKGGSGPADAGTSAGGTGGSAAAGGAGGQISGPPDAAPADGSAAAVGCAGSTFALCEDFEGAAIDAKLWKIVAQKGTVTLDPMRGAAGSKHSVHVHVDPGSDTEVGLVESKTFPALKGGFFARAFIFIPSTDKDLNFTGDRHSRLFYAEGANPYGEYALGIWNGGIIQNHYSQSDDSQDSKKLPPFDQWFCLEYELDAAAGRVAAYLDGVELTELRHNGWPATNVASLVFGVTRFGAFPKSEDIWFDNLAVSNTRIGCTR